MNEDHTPACEARIFPGQGRCTCGATSGIATEASPRAISPEQIKYERVALAMLNDDRHQTMLTPVTWEETLQVDRDIWLRRAACAVYHWTHDE